MIDLLYSLRLTQAPSTLESDDSFVTGKRDRVRTKAESEITKLFERWLNSTTAVLRAAIFGDSTVRFCVVVMPCACGLAVYLMGDEASPSHHVFRALDELNLNAPCVCNADDCLVPFTRDLVGCIVFFQ